MSQISLSLEAGPGSYEIQGSMGLASHKYYNAPRPIIARAKKTNKLFMSVELNKQFSGLESPGVNTYNPNPDKLLSKSPSALFGKEQRDMSYIKPYLNRSPGPVYSQEEGPHHQGISFSKARRNSSLETYSPAPWDYNPKVAFKVPSVVFKSGFEKQAEKHPTPGPGYYNIIDKPKRNGFVSKIGRNIVGSRDLTPGPGYYESSPTKNSVKVVFGSSKRVFDPKKCNEYSDINSHEFFRDT